MAAEHGAPVRPGRGDGLQRVLDCPLITIVKPREREAVGVGGGVPQAPEGGEAPVGSAGDADGSGGDLSAEPEVLPEKTVEAHLSSAYSKTL